MNDMMDQTNMLSNGNGCCDEEEIEATNFNEDSARFDEVVGHIQDILVEKGFQELMRNFYEKYCCEFDYNEENKLEYTPIFHEYVSVIERYMEQYLISKIPDFTMSTFLAEASCRRDELEGEVFDVLSSFADFVIFKQLILDYKSVRDGLVADMSILARPTPVTCRSDC